MKKIIGIILMITTILQCIVVSAAEEENSTVFPAIELQIGDYIILGKYNGESIVWRYVADDENGKLMWSDDILSVAQFGKFAYWDRSYVRVWLNSDVSTRNIRFLNNTKIYKDKAGFMNSENFSNSEKTAIKTVFLRNVLPGQIDGVDIAGEKPFYYAYGHNKAGTYSIDKIEEGYERYKNYESNFLCEQIFLLDPEQMTLI